MNSLREAVVTGIGVASPCGNSPEEFWKQLCAGQSGIGSVRRFDASRFHCRFAAQLHDQTLNFAEGRAYGHEIKRMDRFVQYALFASIRALEDSGLDIRAASPDGAVFVGIGMGGLPNMEAGVIRQEVSGPRKTSPYLIPSLIPNMAAGMIALDHGITGPQYTIAGACAGGLQSLGQAVQNVRTGAVKWALAGGTESVVTPIAFSGFEAMRALSRAEDPFSTPKPFDNRRDGMIIGEGAAFFVVEDRNAAEARGARIHGTLRGYGTCSGGAQIFLQSTDDMIRCMALALADAGIRKSEIDCVYAQAAGLVKGDECEMRALRCLFDSSSSRPAITSIKGHVGHCFGASGPLNVVAALMAMRLQTVSPTRNCDAIETEYASLDIVRGVRRQTLRNCLINAFGFGGVNASFIVSKHEQREID